MGLSKPVSDQLSLDFDASAGAPNGGDGGDNEEVRFSGYGRGDGGNGPGNGGAGPAASSPDGDDLGPAFDGASVLVRELAEVARDRATARKVVVARTRGEGKELLRQVALRGQSWAGIEVTTVQPLALQVAMSSILRQEARVADAFDEQAIAERALDEAVAGGGGRFGRFVNKVGFRDAVRRTVVALREGGVRAAKLTPSVVRDREKQALIAEVLGRYEALLREARLVDSAGVLEMALAALEEEGRRESGARPAGGAPDSERDGLRPSGLADQAVYLLPGLSDRGLSGRFVRTLERRGAVLLKTDAVEGLPPPRHLLWDVQPAEASGSWLHAVGRQAVADVQPRLDEPATTRPSDPRPSSGPRPVSDSPPSSGPQSTNDPQPNGPGGQPFKRINLFAAASVYDELRGVLRRALDRGARWDQVEIVTPDPVAYGSALHALAGPMGIPVNFGVGLPVERTRPGRVASAYFRWIENRFQEPVFRALIEAEDVKAPDPWGWIPGPRLARSLRRLRIGWERPRYLRAVERALESLPDASQYRNEDDEQFERRKKRTEEDLRALKALLDPVLAATPAAKVGSPVAELVAPTTEVGSPGAELVAPSTEVGSPGAAVGSPGTEVGSPSGEVASPGSTTGVSPAAVATGVKSILALVAPGTPTDDTARDRLVGILDRIEATQTRLTDFTSACNVVKGFLQVRVPAPKPDDEDEAYKAPWGAAPGHLHLSDFEHGGATGRPFTFVVGMDSGRFPRSSLEDPLLLDEERGRLGKGVLPLAKERSAEARFLFAGLFARLRGEVALSYCRWDPAEARELHPAPELLQAHRLRNGDGSLVFDDMERAMGRAESRLPRPTVQGDVDASDVWLRALASEDHPLRNGLEAVGRSHPGLARGMEVDKALEHAEASVHVGILGAGTVAGTDATRPSYADPFARTYSASALQDLGTCPRRFLLRHIIRAKPPDDPEFDPGRWLDARERGGLLHAVYEVALSQARIEKLDLDDDRFLSLALDLVDEQGRTAERDIPSPSAEVRKWELEALRNDVRSFVDMIRQDPPRWLALEYRFGFDDEVVKVSTADGPICVRGAIDRLDEQPDGLRVVDYKTGSTFTHRGESRVYDGGRRLQHVLYCQVASQRMGQPADRMEFHFPTRRGENTIKVYMQDDLRHGGDLIAVLLKGMSNGWFPATDDSNDCRFCDYQAVCDVREGRKHLSSRYADWTKQNKAEVEELSALQRARQAHKNAVWETPFNA